MVLNPYVIIGKNKSCNIELKFQFYIFKVSL